MKLKSIVLSMALILLTVPQGYSQDNCDFFPGSIFFKMAEVFSGLPCLKNKNLKNDHVEVCGCVSKIPQMTTSHEILKRQFVQRSRKIVQTNGLAYMQNFQNNSDLDGDDESVKKFKLVSGKIIFDDENVKRLSKEQKESKIKRLEDEEKKRKERKECGLSASEFRRKNLIPDALLIKTAFRDELDSGQTDTFLWDKYLNKNPKLKAINENLPPESQEKFRTQMVARMHEIAAKSEEGTGLWGRTTVEDDVITFKNDKPENNLWVQVIMDYKEGKLKDIVKNFFNESKDHHERLLSEANDVLEQKNGYVPSYKDLLKNDSLWDLYFNKSSRESNVCDAKTVSSGKDPLLCFRTVASFCALYQLSPKDEDENNEKIRLEKVQKWNFQSLVDVDEVYNETNRAHETQVKLFCDTKMPLSHVVDKDGKPLKVNWDIKEFISHLCDKKDIKIGQNLKSKISDDDVSKACTFPYDHAKLQGFFQRVISSSDFNAAAELVKNDQDPSEILKTRKYFTEKSKFDLPTKDDEDGFLAAIESGDPKSALKIFSQRLRSDREYIEKISYNSTTPINTGSMIGPDKVVSPKFTPVIQPLDQQVSQPVLSAGFTNTSVATEAKQTQVQEQIVAAEEKNISEIKQQIAKIEENKTDLGPTSPGNSAFEKQIQDLKEQLQRSEARHLAALEALKKSNSSPMVSEDKNLPAPPNQKNTQNFSTNLNTDVNSSSNGNLNPSGNRSSASVFNAGKISNSDFSAKAGSTNKALLQANSVDGVTNSTFDPSRSGLTIQVVKDAEANTNVGIVSDRGAFQLLKNRDKKIYSRYMEEMISKKIDTLIVRDGNNILRYKLVAKDDGYELHEESKTMSSKEQKYFKKDLANIINSTVQLSQ